MRTINFVRLIVTVPVYLACIVPAMSEEPTPPAPPPEAALASVHTYGRFDKTCLEWTDQCRICVLGACSTVGQLCQPKEITCTRRRTDQDNKFR